MFVTKRIHPGTFPMNGKFTRLLFLKTAKSKKRKTCRNIFFFRTMHTTFPTYICICLPTVTARKTNPDWNGPNTQGMHFPGTKPGRNVPTRHHLGTKQNENVPSRHKKSLSGTKPGGNVPTRHHLGTKPGRNVPTTQKDEY